MLAGLYELEQQLESTKASPSLGKYTYLSLNISSAAQHQGQGVALGAVYDEQVWTKLCNHQLLGLKNKRTLVENENPPVAAIQ